MKKNYQKQGQTLIKQNYYIFKNIVFGKIFVDKFNLFVIMKN